MVHKMTNGYLQTHDYEYWKRTKRHGIYEHVLVYERFNNCCILKWGNVHHKNGIRDDNRPENLEGVMESEHIRLHKIGNKYAKKDMSNRCCSICCSTTTYVKPSGWNQWFKYEDGYMCRKCHDKRRIRNKNN